MKLVPATSAADIGPHQDVSHQGKFVLSHAVNNSFRQESHTPESDPQTQYLLMDHQTSFGELIPCGGGDPIPLLEKKLLIGRRKGCQISLSFPNVSSQHCQLELINGYWNIRDLNSRNGIKVNGVRCDNKWLLPGDELSIAKHRYEVQYQPDTDAPPPEDEDPFAVSLMEKAGLERREQRESRRDSLPPAARPVDNPSSSNGADDEVLGWLSEDDDD